MKLQDMKNGLKFHESFTESFIEFHKVSASFTKFQEKLEYKTYLFVLKIWMYCMSKNVYFKLFQIVYYKIWNFQVR